MKREKRHLPLITINHRPLIGWESCENDAFTAFSRHRVWCWCWCWRRISGDRRKGGFGETSRASIFSSEQRSAYLTHRYIFSQAVVERGIRLRSIWEALGGGFGKSRQFAASGPSSEKERDETSPSLSFAAKLIDPSANYTKTFRQKSAEKCCRTTRTSTAPNWLILVQIATHLVQQWFAGLLIIFVSIKLTRHKI